MKILVLETSTSSVKAMLYDPADGSWFLKTQEYRHFFAGRSELDAEDAYSQLISLGKSVAEGSQVDAIALCSMWHSVMLCDTELKPVTPLYLWMSPMAQAVCERLRTDTSYARHYYERTGCMVNATYPFFRLLRLYESGTPLEHRIVCGMGAYVGFRLTGERAVTRCMVSGAGLLNVQENTYDKELLGQLGIKNDQLFSLTDPGQAYPLTAQAAQSLGLSAGIPVFLANGDGALNQLGSDALDGNTLCMSVGTSGAVRCAIPRPLVPQDSGLWCYAGASGWLLGAATNGACNCVDWFRRNYFPDGTSHADIEKLPCDAHRAPIFLPFLFGERCPGWDDRRRGGFYGLTAEHTPADLYLSVQEGVLFNLYQCYLRLAEHAGIPGQIRISGGILHSARWSQMCADLWGMDLERDTCPQSSMMGAASLAAYHMGASSRLGAIRMSDGIIKARPQAHEDALNRYEKYLAAYENGKV